MPRTTFRNSQGAITGSSEIIGGHTKVIYDSNNRIIAREVDEQAKAKADAELTGAIATFFGVIFAFIVATISAASGPIVYAVSFYYILTKIGLHSAFAIIVSIACFSIFYKIIIFDINRFRAYCIWNTILLHSIIILIFRDVDFDFIWKEVLAISFSLIFNYFLYKSYRKLPFSNHKVTNFLYIYQNEREDSEGKIYKKLNWKYVVPFVAVVVLPMLALIFLISRFAYFEAERFADRGGSAVVQASRLNCRAEPDPQATVVTQFERGRLISIGSERGGWAFNPTESCWVLQRYLAD